MENLYRIILCCNALVSLVAVNSFFFAVISPANCTHFMLIVEAVGVFACGTIFTGAISFLTETLIMSFLWMRRETSMNMLQSKLSNVQCNVLIQPANKAVFNTEMSFKKEAAKNETKSQEPAANADAANSANTDAANADAANSANADAANADAANADGANLNATNTDAAKTEKAASHGKEDPSECHSACSSQGASDTSDAISGASTV
jgi:hypothetical protein